ncbi:MAG: hypothetical protein M5U34_19375 [Chloroflexi bacterium]|nr:hypothetical protein [Chloroflexota bacterium]
MKLHSLRTRILLAFTGLILIGFAALTAFAGQQLFAGTTTDFKERMTEQAKLIARGLKDPVEHLAEGKESAADLEEALQEYADQFGIEVSLLQENGRFLVRRSRFFHAISRKCARSHRCLKGKDRRKYTTSPLASKPSIPPPPLKKMMRIIGIIHLASP